MYLLGADAVSRNYEMSRCFVEFTIIQHVFTIGYTVYF